MRRVVWCAILTWLAIPAGGQIEAAYERGTVGLISELHRMETTARVLHIGAHPDDEDSALLAWLARGQGVRTAYLSLNRGEGGQNALGPELFEPLGILRTEELLAARRLDGAEQYFANVMDFGFSKSADESLRYWDHDRTLADIVAVIRRFKPHVVITRFLGDPGDGHGHHQASGLLCREAFRAAGDPAAFAEQAGSGLAPWQATRLYADRWNLENPPLTVDVGEFSALHGRSLQSIALEGRSRHRSQDMGRAYVRGPSKVPLVLLDSTDEADPTADWQKGFEFALADLVPAPEGGEPGWQQLAHDCLGAASTAVDNAMAYLEPALFPRRTAGQVAVALRELRRADEILQGRSVPRDATTAAWRVAVRQKIDEAQRALVLASGIELDGLASAARVAPGEALSVTAQAFWPAPAQVKTPRLRLEAPAGWRIEDLLDPPLYGDGRANALAGFRVTLAGDAPPTQPYWLRQPRQGYRFAAAPDIAPGEPFAPPALLVNFRCLLEGEPISVSVPVVQRTADPRRGEQRREVAVVPRLTAEVTPAQLLCRPGAAFQAALEVRLVNHTGAPLAGRLTGRLGGIPVRLEPELYEVPAGGRLLLEVAASAEAPAEPTALVLSADGGAVLQTLHALEYDHIAPRQWLSPASALVVPVEAAVAPGIRAGFIPGPGDDLPAALRRLGVEVTALADGDIRAGGFAGFDVIVVGLRAYESNAALRERNAALLEWVREGGRLVVQYQQYGYAAAGLAPLPVTYAEPHDRVTDEAAEVTMLQPDHALLAGPNRLTSADFAGWVQERGLYFHHTWDAGYTPLLSCHDVGEEPKEGGLLVAEVGRGSYVYCAYALFRQTLAGVPGGYRLLANLVSYGR